MYCSARRWPAPGLCDRPRHSRLDLRQRREHDVADDLQAPRADRIERVLGGVPRLVVEIDDVDRGDAGLQEREVIVLDAGVFCDERRVRAPAASPRPEMTSVSHRVEFVSRRMRRSRSPIMSMRTSAFSVASDPSFFAAST